MRIRLELKVTYSCQQLVNINSKLDNTTITCTHGLQPARDSGLTTTVSIASQRQHTNACNSKKGIPKLLLPGPPGLHRYAVKEHLDLSQHILYQGSKPVLAGQFL